MTLALQNDGKILVGGSFTTANGVSSPGIARLNTNGSVDTTFNVGTGANGNVQTIALQSDGEILIGGAFNLVNSSTHYGIARLQASGTLDNSFAPTGPYDEVESVNAIAIQPNGSVVFGGNFVGVDDYYYPFLARVLSTGSLDFNFDYTEIGPNGIVEAVVVPPTGQLLIGGMFTTVNNSPYNYLARLDDAVLPAFFTGATALSNGVYYLQFPDGNYFGYYSYLTQPNYIYHFDLGYEYVFDAQDGEEGVYLYDFASNTFFYTSPYFPFPYLYDFTLNSVLYYYPNTSNPGHYTSNPRYFFNFASGQIITK
jgi:uncharacterized delta-60 repeat protein